MNTSTTVKLCEQEERTDGKGYDSSTLISVISLFYSPLFHPWSKCQNIPCCALQRTTWPWKITKIWGAGCVERCCSYHQQCSLSVCHISAPKAHLWLGESYLLTDRLTVLWARRGCEGLNVGLEAFRYEGWKEIRKKNKIDNWETQSGLNQQQF